MSKRAFLTYTTGNIGDDVQSLALRQHLGEPDLYVNRDRFPEYVDSGEIQLIANGFFTCGPFPPPENVDATYVAMCASSLNGGDPAVVDHLKSVGPIGCRDRHSVRWCHRMGFESYFASCPSILVERTMPYDPGGPVVVVDVDPKLLPPFEEPILCLTHRVKPRELKSPAERFASISRRLEIYQKASLVITNRLHVAMPCLGMGTPLLMVEADSLAFRLTALPDFLRIHKKSVLKHANILPEAHTHDASGWKAMVAQRLADRLEL